jgi:multidrug efflux pump subunit AcrB
VAVVFAFFREWRTTLIPILAIPVSIVGAFFIMQVAGFSINVLTLLGIVLAIGLVVDDAIVVLENIYTKIEAGVPPVEAGIQGTREIFFAVIATTIALAVVFLPLLFLGGLSGRLFREFGVTIAGAVILSAFVALTLTPMLSSRLLRRRTSHSWLFLRTEPLFEALTRNYGQGLDIILSRRWLAPVILVVTVASIVIFGRLIPKELVPMEDRGRITVRATGPEGVSFDYMQAYMDDLTQLLAETIPETSLLMMQVPGGGGGNGAQGVVNSGFVRVFLPDKQDRARSQQDIVDSVQKAARTLPGARIVVSQESTIGERRAGSGGIQFVIQAPNLAALAEVLPGFLDAARESDVFDTVDTDVRFNKPEIQIAIDRDRAQNLPSAASVSDTSS